MSEDEEMKVYTETIRYRVWRWQLRAAIAQGYRHVPGLWDFILPLIEESYSFTDEDVNAEFGPIPETRL